MHCHKFVVFRVILAGRVDNSRQARDGEESDSMCADPRSDCDPWWCMVCAGSVGAKYHRIIAEKLEKWQEPPPVKQNKALPAPDEKPKRKRAGKRCVPVMEARANVWIADCAVSLGANTAPRRCALQ